MSGAPDERPADANQHRDGGGFPMRQIRISKQNHLTRTELEPLPLELRDPDVVRAKQLARQAGSQSQSQRRSR